MAWSVETEAQPGYLIIRISGDTNARVSEEVITKVLREIAAHDSRRLLVDVREASGRLGILDTFNVVSTIPAIQGMRAAIVDRPENSKWLGFYETVSVNRGYNNRVFTDLDEAVKWLTR